MKLSGTMHVHNGVEFDYCFELGIWSMLGCCDEVIVVEAGSTDETPARLKAIAKQDSRLRIISAEWKPEPLDQKTNKDWLRDLMELARSHVSHPFYIHVQADEVLHEDDYGHIRRYAEEGKPRFLTRYNFWGDPQHIAPPGRVCGHWIVRMAPSNTPTPWGNEVIAPSGIGSSARLFHYGFLRRPTSFRKKAEIMSVLFHGGMDPVVIKADEQQDMNVFKEAWPASELREFTERHPKIALPWLRERGYKV